MAGVFRVDCQGIMCVLYFASTELVISLMGISPNTVAFLRDLGHDAMHFHEQGLDRLEDPAILTKARAEGYVLLTHDPD